MKNFTWDRIVRSTHWLVALSIFANLFFNKGGGQIHIILGYLAGGLVIFRLLWAITLAKYPARFRDLIPTPKGLAHHLHEIKNKKEETIGHNHFGLLAIWVMWLLLFALIFTGYHIQNDTEFYYEYNLDDVHEKLALALKMIVGLHVSAVIVTSLWFKRNLIKSMIWKNKEE